MTSFFFEDLPINNNLISDNKSLKDLDKDQLIKLLTTSLEALGNTTFETQELTSRLNDLLTETDSRPAVLFSLLRIATTQAPFSPGLAETLAVLGKERSLNRLKQQIETLKNS